MRSVWGCTPDSSAATLMMYTARSRFRRLSSSRSAIARSLLSGCPEAGPGIAPGRLLQPLQQVLLLTREPRRDLHRHRDQQVAVPAGGLRRPLAPDAKRPPVGGAGRDLQGHRAVQRRHRDLRAERELRVAHRERHGQVAPRPPEDRVRLDPHPDVEVTGVRAAPARLATAGHPDPGAVADPRRDLDGHRARPVGDAGPAAGLARRLDQPPGPAAARARPRHREQPLILDADAAPAALRAGLHLRPRACPRPVTGRALCRAADLERHRGPGHRLVERDAHLRLQVGAVARGAGAAGAPGAARATPEQRPEQPAEVALEPEVAEVLEPDALPAASAREAARE